MPNREGTQAPGPRQGPWSRLTMGAQATRDPLAFFGELQRTYGNFVHLRFGPYRYLMVNDPEAIKHVLVDNPRNYVKSPTYRGLRAVLGQGLITSEGDFWRRQRKLAQPAFHRERLSDFARTMVETTRSMLARWALLPSRSTIDVHTEMMRVTLDIVGRTLMSRSLDDQSQGIGVDMATLERTVAHLGGQLFPIPLWVPTPVNVRLRRARKSLDVTVFGLIEDRRRNMAGAPRDLLTMLMEARDEDTGEAMSDTQLRDEVLTIVTAGHETTANALSWTFYLLSKHPDVARKVYEEVSRVLGDREPALEDLSKMPYGAAVIQEAMRVFPPVWAVEREAVGDDEVGGYHVSKGTLLGIFPWVLHRDPSIWENPEGFDPERFLGPSSRPRYAYIPFGGGPRICIGNAFALMEAHVILAMVVAQHRLELVSGARIVPEPLVTLRPHGGVPMVLLPRKSAAEDLLLDGVEGGRRPDGVKRGAAKTSVALG